MTEPSATTRPRPQNRAGIASVAAMSATHGARFREKVRIERRDRQETIGKRLRRRPFAVQVASMASSCPRAGGPEGPLVFGLLANVQRIAQIIGRGNVGRGRCAPSDLEISVLASSSATIAFWRPPENAKHFVRRRDIGRTRGQWPHPAARRPALATPPAATVVRGRRFAIFAGHIFRLRPSGVPAPGFSFARGWDVSRASTQEGSEPIAETFVGDDRRCGAQICGP